uniref:uncharacterized protein LOC100186252 n=1 Tax=Ciona intestinalis TaxID=7719 RepID=UPI000180C45A|nr:uncharacterized protein LOC100186252 [Ciona intestinalis]|eukprot:XP_002129936.1 uncharacterized protein LOC100186252 [Ciona intestinalis]
MNNNVRSAEPWNELLEILSYATQPIESALLWFKETQYSLIYQPNPGLQQLLYYLSMPLPFVDTLTNAVVMKPRFVHLPHGVQMKLFAWLIHLTHASNREIKNLQPLLVACQSHYEAYHSEALQFYAKLLQKYTTKNLIAEPLKICEIKQEFCHTSMETNNIELGDVKKEEAIMEVPPSCNQPTNASYGDLLEKLKKHFEEGNCQDVIELIQVNHSYLLDTVINISIQTDISSTVYTVWDQLLQDHRPVKEENKDPSLSALLSCVVLPYFKQIEKPVSRQLLGIALEMTDSNCMMFFDRVVIPLTKQAAMFNKAQVLLLTNMVKRCRENRLTLLTSVLENNWEKMDNPEGILPFMQLLITAQVEATPETLVQFVSFLEECVFKVPNSFTLSKLIQSFIKTFGKKLSATCLQQLQEIINQNSSRLQKMCQLVLNQLL